MLSSIEQHLQKEETEPNEDSELANIISTLMKDILPQGELSEKMTKYYCPEN